MGEELTLTVWRRGRELDVKIGLDVRAGENRLIPVDRYDVSPTCYIIGA